MKTILVILGGAIVMLLGILMLQTEYVRRMLRHTQESLVSSYDHYRLRYPTGAAATRAWWKEQKAAEKAQAAS